jgi:dolichol-phosphate mannosyltransferase
VKAVVPGWASLAIIQGVFSGTTLIAVGLLSDYVGRIYEEIKRRPLYIVNRSVNLHASAEPLPPRSVLLRREGATVGQNRR